MSFSIKAPSAAARVRSGCAPARSAMRFVAPSVVPLRSARLVIMRGEPSEEGLKSEKDPYEVPRTGRMSPMSENKQAHTPEQMAAPEGDKAIEGQKWQPTEQDGETPENRYGSKESAEEASSPNRDKSKKSELQTGDMEGQYGEGAA